MAMKKTIRRNGADEGRALRLFRAIKKKLHDSTSFVKRQQSDLFRVFIYAKTSTKVVVVSVILAAFVLGIVSISHSLTSISDKQKEYDELERMIIAQREKNEYAEKEFDGNLDEYIEEIAREKLDMVYPDEQEFINNAC